MTPTSARVSSPPAKKARRRPAPVEAVKPLPLAWKTALDLAGGDPARLVVHSPASITVVNVPRSAR